MCLSRRAAVAAVAIWFIVVPGFGAAVFAAPWVQFDIAPTLACRQVVGEGEAVSEPGEALWEARFRVSSLFRHGAEDKMLQFLLRIESPDRALRVVDYEPKTTLASTLAGNVGVQRHKERSKSLGLVASGAFEPAVKLSGNGSTGSRDVTDVRYELLAPRQLVASSAAAARTSRPTSIWPSRTTASWTSSVASRPFARRSRSRPRTGPSARRRRF